MDNNKYKIVVAGAGYVGLANAVLLSQKNDVTIVDINPVKIELINSKKSPIEDKDIEYYLNEKDLQLRASTSSESYVSADFVLIATPTDYDEDKDFFDTSAIENVLDVLAKKNIKTTVIIKSTIPVGYTAQISQLYPNLDIIFSPEFLREGKALYDSLYPSRVIIGYDQENKNLGSKAEIFKQLLLDATLKENVDSLFMNTTEAEAVKLFANTFLATRVAFFNELDTYAQTKELDTRSIIDGVCLDPRIGDYYNNPSFGYGGYCLPKDTKQLHANFANVPNKLMGAVIASNDTRKEFIARMILEKAGYPYSCENEKAIIGVYRLAMKTGSDNFRNSAILDVMNILRSQGAKVTIYEPTIDDSDELMGFKIIKSLTEFKSMSTLIIANRFTEEISDVENKLYTSDLFRRD